MTGGHKVGVNVGVKVGGQCQGVIVWGRGSWSGGEGQGLGSWGQMVGGVYCGGV